MIDFKSLEMDVDDSFQLWAIYVGISRYIQHQPTSRHYLQGSISVKVNILLLVHPNIEWQRHRHHQCHENFYLQFHHHHHQYQHHPWSTPLFLLPLLTTLLLLRHRQYYLCFHLIPMTMDICQCGWILVCQIIHIMLSHLLTIAII